MSLHERKSVIVFDKVQLYPPARHVYVNAIAQMLKSAGNELFYYTFKEEILKDEEENKTVRSYEIDFLLSRKDNSLYQRFKKRQGYFLPARMYDGVIIKGYSTQNGLQDFIVPLQIQNIGVG